MRITSRHVALALPLLTATIAACSDDIPTRQVGGTEYGLQLDAVSPLRPPLATFTARRSGTTNETLDSLIVTLTNFQPLAGPASYRFYAVGIGAGDTVPVQARLFRIRRDTAVSEAGVVSVTRTETDLATSSFFTGAGFADTVIARFGGAQFGGLTRRFLVVTIQADSTAPAFTAETPRPVWARYRDSLATSRPIALSGISQFGNFEVNRAPYVFVGGGRGRSGFWDRLSDGRLVYSALVENLAQPPLGYYYQPWLRDSLSRRNVRFGELRASSSGESLIDYDERPIGIEVAQLPVARFGTSEQEIGSPLQTFAGVHLIVEPKLGDRTVTRTSVLTGTLGDTLRVGRGSGVLRILALRGADSVPGVSIVAFVEGGRVPFASVTTADTIPVKSQKGQVSISAVPSGNIDLYVTPPGGTTLAPQRVFMAARDTMKVTVTIP